MALPVIRAAPALTDASCRFRRAAFQGEPRGFHVLVMTYVSRTPGGIVTFRKGAICRAFALLIIVLILSPFNAPFATLDLTAVAEIAQGDGDTMKIAADAIVDRAFPVVESAMRHYAWLDPTENTNTPDPSSSIHIVLRI